MSDKSPRRKSRILYLFLLVPYVAVLWVPFYNRIDPTFFGIPFYYWYQMLWIVLGALAILPVYLYEERRRK
ncbi:MAG TPA: DUF3311 domain-containing protein [Rhizomicrobium sp.]